MIRLNDVHSVSKFHGIQSDLIFICIINLSSMYFKYINNLSLHNVSIYYQLSLFYYKFDLVMLV